MSYDFLLSLQKRHFKLYQIFNHLHPAKNRTLDKKTKTAQTSLLRGEYARLILKHSLLAIFPVTAMPCVNWNSPRNISSNHRPQRPHASALNAAKSRPRSEAAGRIADNERSRQENTPIGER